MEHHAVELDEIENRPQVEPALRPQVTLRGLFLVTAYFALTSAAAARFGIGLFMMMTGWLLAWLSFRGHLAWAQTRRVRPRLFGGAWLLLAGSLALPALTFQGCNNGAPTTYYGWEAAVSTALVVQHTTLETLEVAQTPSRRSLPESRDLAVAWLLAALWNLPNALVLVSPYLLYRLQKGKGDRLSAIVQCAAVSSWMWGVTQGADLRVGYYVWSMGITLLSLARPPTFGSLGAMLLTAVTWTILALLL